MKKWTQQIINSLNLFFNGKSLISQNEFVTTWKTTTANETITIPTKPGLIYNYDVDWDNDGVFESIGNIGDAISPPFSPGNHTIRIRRTFPSIYFNNEGDKDKIISIEQWGNIPWETMERAFNGCVNLQCNASDAPDLSRVTNMSFMFAYAIYFNSDISNWNIANVTDLSYIFQRAISFNGDISQWDTSSVIDMSFMFAYAGSFNGDISAWNTSNVTNMSYMFYYAISYNGNMSTWNTANVINMRGVFFGASLFNGDIGTWNILNVTNMSYMFYDAISYNGEMSTWNTLNVTDMRGAFLGASSFDQDIGSWNVESVTNFTNMFNGASLSKVNYDVLLIGWDAQNLQPDLYFDGGNSQYCSSAAVIAWQNISDSHGWTIVDGGESAVLEIKSYQ